MTDHIDAIAERLKLMHAEITNGTDTLTAYTDPPPEFRYDALPLIYTVFDHDESETQDPSTVVRVYVFYADLFVMGHAASGITASGVSAGKKAARLWVALVQDYYDNHRFLRTNAAPTTQLAYLYPDEGLEHKVEAGEFSGNDANDSQLYYGGRFTLSIPMLITRS